MVWQRMIRGLVRRNRRQATATRTSRRRRLRHELLGKRELLASDLGAISGITFADLTQDGLTEDDTRLANVTVELYTDDDDSGTLTAGDTLVDTTTSDANGLYFFRGFGQDTYIVSQQDAGPDLIPPDPVAVEITDDSGAVLTIVDDFTQTGQMVTADGDNPTASSSTASPESIGGFRDILVNRTSDVGILNVAADANDDTLSVGSQTMASGTVLVQYDGDDGSTDLDPTGLGGISLAGGDAGDIVDPDAGILIEGVQQLTGNTVTVTIYTDADNFAVSSPVELPPQSPGPDDPTDIFLRYVTDFTVTGNPDFNNVGAIEFLLTSQANNDSTFAAFTVRGPNVNLQNLPNEQLVTLGGTVWEDMGGDDLTNNGLLDSGEVGVEGIAVDLYAEPDGGGSIDPAVQTPILSTTTDVDGDYVFENLSAGNYVVVIPDSEFDSGEILFGHLASTGLDPVPDPNNGTDGDNNGTYLPGIGILTAEITLVAGQQPLEPDQNPNTNFTIDFGVTPTVELEITKTFDDVNSNPESLGQVFFDIDFENNGLLDATNVVIEDVIPTGMTINEAASDFGTFTPTIDGQNLIVAIGTLAPGATGSIRVAVDVDDGQSGDLTNTASISCDQVDTDPDNDSDDATVSLVTTDLVITKTDNRTDPVVAGEEFKYTIVVTNEGPDTAEGIVVTDNLPADLSFVSGTFVTGTGTITEDPSGSGELSIAVDDLGDGESASFEIVVLVAEDASDELSNTATVIGSPNTDSDPNNNSATEVTPTVRNVDVAVTKTVTGTPSAGGQITFEFEVTNDGPGEARDVEVTDLLNAAFTLDSFDAQSSGVTLTEDGQLLTFDVGTLANDATVVFSIVVDISASATGTINNEAGATTSDEDTDTDNNISDVDVDIQGLTDLVLTKSVDLATAVPGDDVLTYTFTISHDTDSMSDSGEVTFTDMLPAELTGLTIDAPDATSSGFDTGNQTVTVVYDPIPVGQTRTFTVTARVNEDATGTVLNEGSIDVEGGDFDETNNSDTAETTLTPEFDVTLTKTADDTTPTPGSDVTYTIELSNSGPSTATGVVLTDDVPDGLTFVSGTLDGQSATLSGDVVTFPEVTIDDDDTLTATLVFTVGIDTSGTVTNTADVTADDGETDTTNNTAAEDITVTPQADLVVEKSVDLEDAQIGATLVYTVTVTNDGPSTALDTVATDTLPDGVTFVSGTGPDGALSESGGTIIVDGGDLAPDDDFTFTITVTIDSDASGTLTNSVTAESSVLDPDTSDNTATVDTVVDSATSSISGVTYLDRNDNGVQDADEPGIAGVEIELTGVDSLGNDVNQIVLTDEDGRYEFVELAAGTYDVVQTQPDDFRDGQTTAGTGADATVTDNAFLDLELGVGADAIDFNFGELAAILSKRRFLASS